MRIDEVEPSPLKATGAKAVEEIFADVSADGLLAAREVLACLKENPQLKELIDAARVPAVERTITSSVPQFWSTTGTSVPPGATGVWLRASSTCAALAAPTTELVKRTREALQA